MIAVESEIRKSPSWKPGILPNGLAFLNSSGPWPMPAATSSTSMPFSAANASVLRTYGDRVLPKTFMSDAFLGLRVGQLHPPDTLEIIRIGRLPMTGDHQPSLASEAH